VKEYEAPSLRLYLCIDLLHFYELLTLSS